MRRLKVALILHTLQRGGAPKLALDTFEKLADKVIVRIFALEDGPLRERCKDFGGVEVLPPLIWSRTIRKTQWRMHNRLLSLSLSRWKPDVIYINSVAALPFAWYVKIKNIPVLLHVHELHSHLQHWTQTHPDLLLDLPDRYIAVSNAVRDALVDTYGIPDHKVSVVNAFADESKFQLAADNHNPNSKPFIVGGAGFVSWCKGFVLWLQMACYLSEMIGADNVRFVWVGVHDDDEANRLKLIAEKLKISQSIQFIHQTTEPERYYKLFDVFATTSWEDSCPLVVIENMLLGKPVFCFAGSGGAPEEVGDTSIIIDEFSPRKMAEAIAELYRDRSRLTRLGDAARKRALENFTGNIQIPRIYEQIVRLSESDG